ncbi:hypothetical protein DLM46_01440 [Paraburkholderia lacunae]|uniref:Uncharacterized protein n=1 Tax=Paraburkholderia lacunae TaxID=2211104 RepID=A0A370NG32_9BURK|nr:hypothetical protein DLM46_01440 [Paraburkholderia lacunae]
MSVNSQRRTNERGAAEKKRHGILNCTPNRWTGVQLCGVSSCRGVFFCCWLREAASLQQKPAPRAGCYEP